MEYLLKASAIIIIFYLSYKLFLQRITFFESNRAFLLIGLLSAFLIPLIVIPVFVEAPSILKNTVIVDNVNNIEPAKSSLGFTDIISYIYIIGFVVFMVRFIFQLASLFAIILKTKSVRTNRYKIIEIDSNYSPFSFFNWIVYNPKLFNKTELRQILDHEKAHANQYHSIDVLIAQITCIVLWLNPFVWLYFKDLKQNLEFIADKKAQLNCNDKKNYQYTLLKTIMPKQQITLTNNFYNSLIKKRIIMLHKSKSKKTSSIKYAIIIPLLALFLMSFNTKEVYISTETTPEQTLIDFYQNDTHKKNIEKFTIHKDFSDNDFNILSEQLENKGLSNKFTGIKRNSANEIISIKIELSSKNSSVKHVTNSSEIIKPIIITVESTGENQMISIGNTSNYKDDHDDIKHKIHVKNDHEIEVIGYGESEPEFREGKNIISGDSIVFTKAKTIYKILNDNETPLYFIDGKEVTSKEVNNLDHDIIESIDVSKGENAINKYGDKGENGVVIITTKNQKTSSISLRLSNNPLFIVDGKEVNKSTFESIAPKEINSVDVLKGEKAINKCGKKGENGVIIITTKKE